MIADYLFTTLPGVKINRRRRIALWLLPVLGPLLIYVHLRVPLTSQISYIGVYTTILPEEFEAHKAADAMLEVLAQKVAASEKCWIKTDYIETHWRDTGGMWISYNRKTREARCGYDGGGLVYTAWKVSPADLAKAAERGGSFRRFKNWVRY